jgi:dihydroorotate dehydrogenase
LKKFSPPPSQTLAGTYDVARSYEENYQAGPLIQTFPPPRTITPKQTFIGFPVNSLLGVPAGPLLNANWILAYAALGFDLLVYKTVRTASAPSHPNPNCVFLQVTEDIFPADFGKQLVSTPIPPASHDKISITNSFGMPSRDPKLWQDDVQIAKRGISPGQVLIVSVVGTPGASDGDLAADYAKGALLAKEAGADMVEINLSCPNVATGEGSVYTDPDFSSKICKTVKQAIGSVPLIIKIGYLDDPVVLAKVVRANAPHIDAISGINTLSFEVVDAAGAPALPGRKTSGVCGAAIRGCSMAQAARVVALKERERYDFSIIGVGGIMTTDHIRQYFRLGVDAVMSATGAMWDPYLAYRYGEEARS